MLAFIIFGTRGVTSTIKEGEFYCPQCACEKHYRHRKVTGFFTLYFIPLIPLGSRGEYVECQSCRNTFVERVLQLSEAIANARQEEPQAAQSQQSTQKAAAVGVAVAAAASAVEKDILSEKQKAIKKLLILMILADGKVQDAEIHMFHKVYRETANRVVDNIYAEIETVRTENKSARQYLKEVSAYLNDEGKADVLRASMMIAKADGDVDPTELEMINQFGKSLEMTSEQIKNAIALAS